MSPPSVCPGLAARTPIPVMIRATGKKMVHEISMTSSESSNQARRRRGPESQHDPTDRQRERPPWSRSPTPPTDQEHQTEGDHDDRPDERRDLGEHPGDEQPTAQNHQRPADEYLGSIRRGMWRFANGLTGRLLGDGDPPDDVEQEPRPSPKRSARKMIRIQRTSIPSQRPIPQATPPMTPCPSGSDGGRRAAPALAELGSARGVGGGDPKSTGGGNSSLGLGSGCRSWVPCTLTEERSRRLSASIEDLGLQPAHRFQPVIGVGGAVRAYPATSGWGG